MPAIHAAYAALAAAIVAEMVGTALLQKSEQFTRILPTLAMIACYTASFYFLAQALRAVPLGIAYAIWGGVGIVLVALIGVLVFRQAMDWAAILGIGLIVAGVVVLNGFSQTISH
ncbi:MAG TPA: SMR family transporter [Paracoccaceae bacterium]|nr:SMR family transporter [Paracoccaceae bacterium]